VIKPYEFYQDDKNYFLITEYCNGGELFDRIINTGHFSESIVANYIKQIPTQAFFSICFEF
jgi:Protein kinase domain.